MATKSKSHLNQWQHNRSLIPLIPAQYPDWIITVTFYAALHLVDAVFVLDGVRGITSHQARNEVLARTNRYHAINQAYQPLYSLSRTVRYLANPSVWVSTDTIESQVLERYLYRIEKSSAKLLAEDLGAHKITVASGTDQPG